MIKVICDSCERSCQSPLVEGKRGDGITERSLRDSVQSKDMAGMDGEFALAISQEGSSHLCHGCVVSILRAMWLGQKEAADRLGAAHRFVVYHTKGWGDPPEVNADNYDYHADDLAFDTARERSMRR